MDLAPGRAPRPRAHDDHGEHEEGQREHRNRDPERVDSALVVTLVQFTRPDSEHPASADSVKCAMVR